MSIKSVLQKITPQRVTSEVFPIDGSHDLFDTEESCIRNAVPLRQDEFAAGRAAARAALKTLGISPQSIPRAKDRCPIWPKGIVGSISHSEGFAAALVGHSADIAGIGLDIEGADALKDDLHKYILTPREIYERDARPMVAGSPRCKVTFVAKEALFKAVYPITRTFFGFQDARVEIYEDEYWDSAFVNSAFGLPSGLTICRGNWSAVGNLIIATVCVKGTQERRPN
ncbi:MAG: 4'-phosphopantetheinyl transferase superfamily protein [Hyphomicrobiales bacterium]